jgi:arginase
VSARCQEVNAAFAEPDAEVRARVQAEDHAHVDETGWKQAVVAQLAGALAVIGRHHPQRILTLGGECSVSVEPFSWLAERYGDELAALWIDSHPDIGTPASHYSGYHAMAVAVLTGHGDPDVLRLLPATLDPRCRGARGWPSISMSMWWIATRSSSVLVRSLTA